jgi:AcrR family transcriptional regulator
MYSVLRVVDRGVPEFAVETLRSPTPSRRWAVSLDDGPPAGASASRQGLQTRRQRRERILDAALAIGSSGGYEAVQMRAVAQRAGVAVGTVYRHFPSKVHVLVSALERVLQRLGADIESAASADTARQRLNDLIDHLNNAMLGDPLLAEAMIRARAFADASAATEVDRISTLTDDMFAQAISDGQASDVHYRIARVISDVWLSNLLAWLTRRATTTDVKKRLNVAVRLLVRDEAQTNGADTLT